MFLHFQGDTRGISNSQYFFVTLGIIFVFEMVYYMEMDFLILVVGKVLKVLLSKNDPIGQT